MQEIGKDKPDHMDKCLTRTERRHVANLAVFNFLPTWFYAARGIGRALAEDERERAELLAGLDAIAKWFEQPLARTPVLPGQPK